MRNFEEQTDIVFLNMLGFYPHNSSIAKNVIKTLAQESDFHLKDNYCLKEADIKELRKRNHDKQSKVSRSKC